MRSKVMSIVLAVVALSLATTFLATPPGVKSSAGVPPPPQQTDQASTALQQGRRLLKRGRADQALIQLQNALNLYTAAKNNRGIGAARNELGDLYLRQGQYEVAMGHYRKALDGFVGADKKQEAVTAAASVADSRLANANIADDKFNANLMLAKIGDINYRLGRNSEAMAAYGRMDVKKPEGAAKKAGRRFGGLGAVLGSISTGDVSIEVPTSAAVSLIEAKKELDLYRTSIIYASYQLGMGRIAYANNDLKGAEKYFDNAREASGNSIAGIAKLGQTRRFRAAARTSLGDVDLRQGKFKDAIKEYNEAEKGAKDDKRLDLMWPAQRGQARGQWLMSAQEKDAKKAASMRESAIANYRDAIKTLETLRSGSLRADEARTTFLATTKDVFDEASSSLAEMALMAAAPGGAPLTGIALEYAAEAFQINEQARARSLLELLSETNASITEGVPADLLKRKQDNLDRQQEIADSLTGVGIAADEKKKPSQLEAELEKLQTDYEAVENEIRTASPRYAALTSNQPLTLAEVRQKVLDDHTLLLEYSLGAESSYVWAVSQSAVSLYKLPAKSSFEKLVVDLRAQLIPSKLQRRIVGIDVMADQERGLGIASAAPQDAAPFVAASNALYKAALEPAAAMVGEKRLLIVADGALNYVPFEVLLRSADSGDFSSLAYLVSSNEIVYAPSASVVSAIRQQRKPAGKALLIVADPVFNSNDPRAQGTTTSAEIAETRGLGIESALKDVSGQDALGAAQSARIQGLPLARLAGTRLEAEEISKLANSAGAPSDLWLDLDASEENFAAREMSNYRVLHIATHGLLDAERPQFTGIVFSLIGNKNVDGFLRTDEVFNLRLGSPLVMLSACETGLGKERRGEGVMGLARAFMYAGAPTVGVSLWSVADKSTAELMTNFYQRLLRPDGASPTTALREAQLAMISGKKYSAPFYWAPFVLAGDWR